MPQERRSKIQMKKIVSVLLILSLAVALVGCDALSGGELTRGTIEENTYTNTFLGFSFTKPSAWTYSSDEEIAAMVNLGAEAVYGDNFKETLEKSESLCDMMAVDPLTSSNISIGYDNLKKTFTTSMTVEEYVETVKKQYESVEGVEASFSEELVEVRLGEVTFTRVCCSLVMYGVEMEQAYYLHKTDGYMVFVVVTLIGGYTVSQIEAMFN